jgi:hypothetical protein
MKYTWKKGRSSGEPHGVEQLNYTTKTPELCHYTQAWEYVCFTDVMALLEQVTSVFPSGTTFSYNSKTSNQVLINPYKWFCL